MIVVLAPVRERSNSPLRLSRKSNQTLLAVNLKNVKPVHLLNSARVSTSTDKGLSLLKIYPTNGSWNLKMYRKLNEVSSHLISERPWVPESLTLSSDFWESWQKLRSTSRTRKLWKRRQVGNWTVMQNFDLLNTQESVSYNAMKTSTIHTSTPTISIRLLLPTTNYS